MPKLILIYPAMGRRPGKKFVRSWQQEPLAIGILAALTPQDWEVVFFDDRVEAIDYSRSADLVGISLETYTARRGYQIAEKFRRNKIPVVFGGYHATLCPDEALEYGDAVCVGEAEGVWANILHDAVAGNLQSRYEAKVPCDLKNLKIRREIFKGKNYLPLSLIETSRGCPMKCNFCSITAFHRATYRQRPPTDVVEEIRAARHKYIFFVDDNFAGNTEGTKAFCRAVKPLKRKWITQCGITGLKDPELVRLLAESGCIGLLIGFESLNPANLKSMNKKANKIEEYSGVLECLRKNGIFVYGTFMFGYPEDTAASFDLSVAFAMREKMFIAAFNHLVPFPGTPLYRELEQTGQLNNERWWLDDDFYFGQTPVNPRKMT
ncbi:MAG: radical SAM protein, partial [Victivallales bacterium]|nr:radical SAM protein [Victivallales bacterium]